MRVGLLGGSFDPVHYGHLRAAQWALQALELDEVRLVPARQSPFKGPSLGPETDRLTMLNLATHDNAALVVETCELEREAPSYTVDTLRALTRRMKDARFTLILGSDAARGFEQWRESSEIRHLAEIRVLGRPGDTALDSTVPAFNGLSISSTQIRDSVKAGRSIRYLTPESVRLYIEEKGLYK
ncbi:MAG: nicotinate (nicotinamide) nucleotide adenylyltransferase [Vicinamibacteria bacterium]